GGSPEARRAPTVELLPFRPGVGVLLKDSRCLVVPTHVSGTYEAWPPKRSRPRVGGRLRVAFGEAVSVADLVAEGRGETDELKIVDALERRLAPPAPRGAPTGAASCASAAPGAPARVRGSGRSLRGGPQYRSIHKSSR